MEQRVPKPDIQMKNFEYQPAEVKTRPGAELTWVNNDPVPHTITAEDGSFDSGNIMQGESFTYTFKEKGTFTYYCRIHPRMRGQVVVE